MSPQGADGPPYEIYQCTSDAGWGSSAIMTYIGQLGYVTSRRMKNAPRDNSFGEFDAYGYVYLTALEFANTSSRLFPERRISVSKDWMNFLNPIFVSADNSTTTFISRWLSSATVQLEEGHVARMFAVLLSVALSNTGIELGWKGIYEYSEGVLLFLVLISFSL